MKVPTRDIGPWAKELIAECQVSREARRSAYAFWRNLYYRGSVDETKAKHNRCFSLIDTLSSYLFSPSEVRFSLSVGPDETEAWGPLAEVAGRHLNRAFSNRGCDVTFAQGVDVALEAGCSFVKCVWGRQGYEPYLIRPQFMGVLREDIEDLDRQDAFTHSFYLTEAQFKRLLGDRPDRAEIMHRVQGAFDARAESEIGQDYFHEIVAGGVNPISTVPPTQQQYGMVGVSGAPVATLAPEVAKRLIRVDDLWVMNDKLEDWTTIRFVDPDLVIEGADIHRNLSDIPHEQPFVKICPNPVAGYFWGRSELSNVQELQMLLNARIDNIDNIFRLRTRPPKSFTGFSSIDDEKARALLTPGGYLADSSPTGKIETHAPEMPAEALDYIRLLDAFFDDAAGLTNILSGKGESGVRAGVHANTLLRTSSPRLRDRALLVEKQVAVWGDLWLKMSQAKDATVFKSQDGREFTLKQLPTQTTVVVDSHTSSPAFSEDNKQTAFLLAKAGAIDGDTLIEMVHPPHEEELKDRFRKKKAAEAKLIQEHPELLQKGGRSRK